MRKLNYKRVKRKGDAKHLMVKKIDFITKGKSRRFKYKNTKEGHLKGKNVQNKVDWFPQTNKGSPFKIKTLMQIPLCPGKTDSRPSSLLFPRSTTQSTGRYT